MSMATKQYEVFTRDVTVLSSVTSLVSMLVLATHCLVQSIVMDKWDFRLAPSPTTSILCQFWNEKKCNRKKMVSFACMCLGVCVRSKVRGLHLMWWRRLSTLQIYTWTYKCLGSERVVWEWTRICCSSSLKGYRFPPSVLLLTITPSQSFCYSTPPKKTTWNLKLITSDGTTLTEPVLQDAVWSVASPKPVESSCNCAALSKHPGDTLHRVGHRGAERYWMRKEIEELWTLRRQRKVWKLWV